MKPPILYSFRRCPYAMRARLALTAANQQVELREILLRDKPAEMVEASPKATVPVMVHPNGEVLEESLDIMLWALEENDPNDWLSPQLEDREAMLALIARIDGPFKHHLDHYKYASRKVPDGRDPTAYADHHRQEAMICLQALEERLAKHPFLFGDKRSLADAAIAPFVRQFANTDRDWFDVQPMPNLQRWLGEFIDSALFASIMTKFAQWQSTQAGVPFPSPQQA